MRHALLFFFLLYCTACSGMHQTPIDPDLQASFETLQAGDLIVLVEDEDEVIVMVVEHMDRQIAICRWTLSPEWYRTSGILWRQLLSTADRVVRVEDETFFETYLSFVEREDP